MVLRPLVALALVAGLAPVFWRTNASAQSGDYTVTELGRNLHLIAGRGGNAVVLADPAGTLLVNCKYGRDAAELQKVIAGLGGGPLRWLLLTDDRPEHSDAVAAFPRDLTVVAHHRTDQRLRAEARRGADLTFDSTVHIRVGTRLVTMQHKGSAATDGVAYVHFHEAQVLVLGTLVHDQYHPVILPDHGGSIRSSVRVLRDLRKDYKNSSALQLVPGEGKPGPHALFDQQLTYWNDVIDATTAAHEHGETLEEAYRSAEPVRLKYASWRGEHWRRNVEIAYRETAQ